MKVLVTGANGFLGRHVVKELSRRAYHVRAMLRHSAMLSWSPHPNIEEYRASFGKEEDLPEAVAGCDAVIHCAADTRQSHRSPKDYRAVNVEASLNLFRAAQRAGIARFVFVSTANTLGYGSIKEPGHEGIPAALVFRDSGYARSKIEAETVLRSADKGELVIVNPTFLIGPDDARSGSEIIFSKILGKKLIPYPPGGKNYVDVRDAACGIVNALEKGRSGEKYLLSGENSSYEDFFRRVVKLSGQGSRVFGIPSAMLILAGRIGSFFRLMGFRAVLHLTNARILCIGNYYRNDKARKELGVDFRPLNESIDDVLAWKSRKTQPEDQA